MDTAVVAALIDRGDSFFIHSPDPFLRVRRDGVLLCANDASAHLLRHWNCATGTPLPGKWQEVVARVLADGARLDVEETAGDRLYALTFIPLDNPECVQVYGFDMTARNCAHRKPDGREQEFRRAQEALRMSEARMRSLQENLPLALYRSTPEGRIEYANGAMVRMFGYDTPEDLYKSNTDDLYVDTSQREHVLSVLEKHGLIKDWEVRLRRRDGTVIDCALNVRAVFDLQGSILHQDGIISDITERKRIQEALIRAKEQAEAANRIKSNFLATMSHELRTPLNGILGFASLLEEALEGDDELREMAEVIHISGFRLLDTLNSILDLSIVEAGKLHVSREPVDVKRLVAEVGALYEASASNKGLHIHCTLPDDAVEAETDERLLRQILNNLCNNAIKYTHDGSVTLVAEPAGTAHGDGSIQPAGIRIHVADTGIGIATQDQEVIFDAFRQVSEGYGRSYDGSGLGLSISQKFAHLLGGRITLISVPDKGSCFTLHLPTKNP